MAFAEDPNGNSERNRFKIESSSIPLGNNGGQGGNSIIVAEINVPSRYCEDRIIVERLDRIQELLEQQTGVNLALHRPFISIQASFLLTTLRGDIRVFTGSSQRAMAERNFICQPETIASLADLTSLVERALDPNTIDETFNSARRFPNSRWSFAGIISLIIVVNCRARLNRDHRHQKLFYAL